MCACASVCDYVFGERLCSLGSALSLRTAHSACVGGLAVIYWKKKRRKKKLLHATHINSSPRQMPGVASAEPVIVPKNG